MRRSVVGGGILGLFAFWAVAGVAWADELTDLKKRLEALQKEMAQLHERIGRMEAERVEAAQTGTLHWRWKDGLRFESADKDFKFKLTGGIQNDWAFAKENDQIGKTIGKVEDGTEFRRIRLGLQGKIYDQVTFESEVDFAGGLEVKDVTVGLTDLPVVGSLTIGHFKHPFSMEELTSSKYITFMERGLPNVFAPGRGTGAMVGSPVLGDRATWALGVFRPTDDFGDGSGGGEYSLSGRLTAVPVYQDEGQHVLHLGGAYTFVNPNNNTLRYRQRPEVHLAPRYVDTGSFTADSVHLFGGEAAWVRGPLSLQAEAVGAMVDSSNTNRQDPFFHGLYAFASYFLTGEHRPYDLEDGEFGRVKPNRNFLGEDGGPGAWEVALRWSKLSLDSKRVSGRELRDLTAAINWYLNPNTRVMLNYVFADLEDVGDSQTVQSRFQIDW